MVRLQPGSPLVRHMAPVFPLPDNRAISRASLSLLLTEDTVSR